MVVVCPGVEKIAVTTDVGRLMADPPVANNLKYQVGAPPKPRICVPVTAPTRDSDPSVASSDGSALKGPLW